MNVDIIVNNYVDNILNNINESNDNLSYYNNFNNLNNSDDENDTNEEVCPICLDVLKENDIVELKCGHKFHYNCILDTYKNENKKNIKYKNRCPYCRSDGGSLPFKEGMLPIKYVHREYEEYVKYGNIEKYLVKGVCQAILKSGKNAGCQCKKKIFKDGFCKRHST